MHTTLAAMIDRIDSPAMRNSDIIGWSSPVPTFGNLEVSKVATLGINPSNREFVDEMGVELDGQARRFHTLGSLSLDSWADADYRHFRLIVDSCCAYFSRNPYDRWFKTLDRVVCGAGASYYDQDACACHLDLIPYATTRKWTELKVSQKSKLLESCVDHLGLLIRDSPVRIMILNGRTVIEHFLAISTQNIQAQKMPEWSLPRVSKPHVVGVAYKGWVNEIGGIHLERSIFVLGFNHNLQSSFGVTSAVMDSIRDWISNCVGDMSNET